MTFDETGDNARVNELIMQLRSSDQKIVLPQNLATTPVVWPMTKRADRKPG